MSAETTAKIQCWTHDQIATRVVCDILDGSIINLGIGLPTLVTNQLPADREIILHTENGLLGMGPAPVPGQEDEDLINTGKQPVTIKPGASFFHHADSFAMMRGSHPDYCVLGTFQVSATNGLANWHTGAPDAIPVVGGAMDLAIGAKRVFVMMEHQTKQGESKIVPSCMYPLTDIGCVDIIYADLTVIDITPEGLVVCEIADGLDFDTLQTMTAAPLRRTQSQWRQNNHDRGLYL